MIEFHADDFGLFPRQSRRILECCEKGVLNGVSILPNSDCLPECMEMLEPYMDRVAVTVHLNLVEGHSLSAPEDVPLLVDKAGNFNISFGKLLLASFSPARRDYANQIREEFKKQIRRVWELCGQKNLRLDSHVHYHMIPVVFDAMMEAVAQENFSVTYIRIPAESLRDYRPIHSLAGFQSINLVKYLVLNTLACRDRRKYRAELAGMEQKTFYGVVCSGYMCYETARRILTSRKAWPHENEDVEMLFHPGSVLEPEDQSCLTSADDRHFLTHAGRAAEAEALVRLKEDSLS